jgi:mannan endo-1,4-beta-mannosidase
MHGNGKRLIVWAGVGSALAAAAVAATVFLSFRDPEAAQSASAPVFEAKAGALYGVEVSNAAGGFSGDGDVTGFDAAEDAVTVPVEATEEGLYEVWIGFSSPGGDKYTTLSLAEDRQAGEIRLARADTFMETCAGKWMLRAGRNDMLLSSNWGWYNIDCIKDPEGGKTPGAPGRTQTVRSERITGSDARRAQGAQILKDAGR